MFGSVLKTCLLAVSIITIGFSQRTYDLYLERFVKVLVDPEYLQNITLKVSRINRTHMVISGEFQLNKLIDQNVKYAVFVYERTSGTEYKLSPVQIKDKVLCEFFDREKNNVRKSEYAVIEHFMNHTNLPKNCPISPGVYVVNNYILDPKVFPPHIPGKNWRADLFLSKDELILIHAQLYVRVEPAKFIL